MIGAGGSLTVLLSTGQTVSVGLSGTTGTVQDMGASPVFTLGNDNTLTDFTIDGGTTGVSGSGIDGVTLSGLTVTGSSGNGLDFSDTTGDI
ncbi:hypothetical protein [Breoghania sp.]|uniref:hypothetical protein n=1 Tax=Breoghania sp. TaxID=2065378 RepID=UPI0026374AE1|nr:hypothetical protein [Breoghania sp.]MDJ0929607.1 hypothetical protein [Breoghania sp.]